ncbi:MAG: O-antigen ligase family protein, partial [Kiritimatiellae bacterium]|nr:O-antigen ligase family protein [Kiritimatiellia bacterium]
MTGLEGGVMKYLVFFVAMLGTPALAFVLMLNRRWLKWVCWAMAGALCAYIPTSINFFSHENYRGTSRGMEVSVIHLLACAILGSLALRGKRVEWFPDTGSKIFAAYFLLCLPSLGTAANHLYSWFEIWKMMLLPLLFAAVYNYLKTTDDLKTVTGALAGFAVANAMIAVKQHFSGVYQSYGVFPHQNSMAMAMLLLGPLFFAGYLSGGMKGWIGKLRAAAFCGAGLATMLTYSRGAMAMVPVGYGLTGLFCLVGGRTRGWMLRLAPVAMMGGVLLFAMLPQIIERFETAPEASGETRVELARCAREMIKDKPLVGVGINNWGRKINEPYP